MQFLKSLKQFDLQGKSKPDVQVRTVGGAIVSVISVVFMVMLFFTEFGYYRTTETVHTLGVDTSRADGLNVSMYMRFHKMQCAALSVKVGDVHGRPYDDSRTLLTFSPYVAREFADLGLTYTPLTAPGCTIEGIVQVRRLAGLVSITAANQAHYNLSHEIQRLSVGDALPDYTPPLQGVRGGFDDAAVTHYKYYMKLVPTHYKPLDAPPKSGYQYSMTRFLDMEHKDGDEDHGSVIASNQGSGVVLMLDFTPIMVTISQRRRTFLQFLTGVCAILGGVFTVAGMIDSTLYTSQKALKKAL